MANALFLIILYFFIIRSIAKAGKKGGKTKSKAKQKNYSAYKTNKPAGTKQKVNIQSPLPNELTGHPAADSMPSHGHESAPSTHAQVLVKTSIAPRVHTRVETRVAVSEQEEYTGSMNATTLEGVDPCHEAELTPRTAPVMQSPAASSAWTPDFTPNALMNAIIMNEVLTRPQNRRR